MAVLGVRGWRFRSGCRSGGGLRVFVMESVDHTVDGGHRWYGGGLWANRMRLACLIDFGDRMGNAVTIFILSAGAVNDLSHE
jgi:hypothetical protein